MNPNQLVTETRRNFVERIALMFELRFDILAKIVERRLNICGIEPNVLPTVPKSSSPPPGIAEHPLMQGTNEIAFDQPFVLARKRPVFAFEDVRQLPLVKLPLRRDMGWNQARRFIRVEWSCTRWILEFYRHRLRALPVSNVSMSSLR